MRRPYWDVEPTPEPEPPAPPVRVEVGPACELCGDDWELIAFPLWSEERGYWTGTRCADGPACRARQDAARAPKPRAIQPKEAPAEPVADEGDNDGSWI